MILQSRMEENSMKSTKWTELTIKKRVIFVLLSILFTVVVLFLTLRFEPNVTGYKTLVTSIFFIFFLEYLFMKGIYIKHFYTGKTGLVLVIISVLVLLISFFQLFQAIFT